MRLFGHLANRLTSLLETPIAWLIARYNAAATAVNRTLAKLSDLRDDTPAPTPQQWAGLVEEWEILCSRAAVHPIPPVVLVRRADECISASYIGYGEHPDHAYGPALRVGRLAFCASPRARTHLLAIAAARFLTGQTAPDTLTFATWIGRGLFITSAVTAGYAVVAYTHDRLFALGVAGLATVALLAASTTIRRVATAWATDRTRALDQVAERVCGSVLTFDTVHDLTHDPGLGEIVEDDPYAPSWGDRADHAWGIREADTALAIVQDVTAGTAAGSLARGRDLRAGAALRGCDTQADSGPVRFGTSVTVANPATPPHSTARRDGLS